MALRRNGVEEPLRRHDLLLTTNLEAELLWQGLVEATMDSGLRLPFAVNQAPHFTYIISTPPIFLS